MGKFCSESCKAICDYCKFYRDYYRDMLKLTDEEGNLQFAGLGTCLIAEDEVDAGWGCGVHFECINIED